MVQSMGRPRSSPNARVFEYRISNIIDSEWRGLRKIQTRLELQERRSQFDELETPGVVRNDRMLPMLVREV